MTTEEVGKPKPVTEESGIQNEWYERAKKVKSVEELTAFVTEMREDYQHDYGTICHAVAAAAIAAMWCVERGPQGGITGFQAGCIIWQVIEKWGSFDTGPKRMLCYHDMLYPQYEDKFDKVITPSTWAYLQAEAKKLLLENTHAGEGVKRHWFAISVGEIPFGYRIKDE